MREQHLLHTLRIARRTGARNGALAFERHATTTQRAAQSHRIRAERRHPQREALHEAHIWQPDEVDPHVLTRDAGVFDAILTRRVTRVPA